MKKSVTSNFLYNMLYQILITLLPLITTPFMTRTLGKTSLAIHSFTEANVTYFMLFASLGISLYGCRKIATVRDDADKLKKVTWELIILKMVLFFITLVIYIPAMCLNNENNIIYVLHIINLLANAIEISWFFQGIENFKTVTLRNTIVKILFVICLFVFIRQPSDLYLYVFLIVISSLFGNLIMWYYLFKEIGSFKDFKKLHPFSHLRGTIALFVPQLTGYIYALVDKTMLGIMSINIDEVAIYDYPQRLIRVVVAILQSLGYVMLARISNLYANKDKDGIRYYINKSISFTLFLAFPMIAGMIGISQHFIPLYLGDQFQGSVIVLIILSPIILALSLNSVLGVQLLISLGRERIYMIATTSGAVINTVLNFIMIPRMGAIGASLASVVTEFVVLTMLIYFSRDYISIKNIAKQNAIPFIASAIMLTIILCIQKLPFSGITILMIQMVVGVIIYFTIMIATKNEICFAIIEKVRSFVKAKIGGSYES